MLIAMSVISAACVVVLLLWIRLRERHWVSTIEKIRNDYKPPPESFLATRHLRQFELPINLHIEAQRKHAAYHEAGHAVARVLRVVPGRLDVAGVEIGLYGGGLDGCEDNLLISLTDPDACWNYVMSLHAGIYAEARARKKNPAEIYLGGTCTGDLDEALTFINRLVSEGHASDYDAAQLRARKEVRAFIGAEWPKIERVAQALLSKGKLSGTELKNIIEQTAECLA